MRSIDRIVADPRVWSGKEASIAGTGVTVSNVVTELSLGKPEEQVVDSLREHRAFAGRSLSREDIRAGAAYGAALAREEVLSSPAMAAFAENKFLLGELSVEEVQERASAVLDELAAGMSQQEILGQHPDLSQELFRAAAAYGAALARDEPLPSQEPAEETFLRDMLASHDRKLVEDFYVYGREKWGSYRMTPEKWLFRWKRLVEEVEAGYDDLYEEYANDLTSRDSLEQTVSMVSPSSQDRLLETIRPWDRRFEAATLPAAQRIFPGPRWPWEPRSWWYYRIPRRLGGGMEADLRAVGLL